MVQIISDKESNFNNWICGVLDGNYDYDIEQAVIITKTNEEYPSYFIEYMNCTTDDLCYLSSLLHKEAIKEEILMELDDAWNDMDDFNDSDDNGDITNE